MHHLRRLALVVTALGAVAATAACGRSQQAAPAAAPAEAHATAALDPCTLLSTATLEGLLGGKLHQRGSAEDVARGRECSWDFQDSADVAGGTLSITAWHGQEFFLAGAIGDPVDGLGDEAQSDPTLGIVLFRSGDEVLQAHVLSPAGRAKAPAVARALADAVARA